MEVKYWDGGLTLHEVEAIKRLEEAFRPKDSEPAKPASAHSAGASMAAQLAAATGRPAPSTGMWPWTGYAGFRFVSSRGSEGEFDLVIVTHKNVLIVELKHWNNGVITANNNKWYLNDREMGRSPVSITQNKVYLLQDKLQPLRSQLPNGQIPRIEFFVVMSGNATFANLPDAERPHVVSIEKLIELGEESIFNKAFPSLRNSPPLQQYHAVFDKLISDGNVKPQQIVVNNYKAEDLIFSHPKGVYTEYQARNLYNKSDVALLRRWNFDRLSEPHFKTQQGRYEVVSRERDVLNFIKQHDSALYHYCLNSKTNVSPEEVTREFFELFEIPGQYQRFNDFVDRYLTKIAVDSRIRLVKLLLQQFAALHEIKVAHRDIGPHSVWLAPDQTTAISSFIAAYHQPLGTVGSQRNNLSIGAISLPEDRETVVDRLATPYHRDIYSLAILSWHIICAKRLRDETILSAPVEISAESAWYAVALSKAVQKKPTDRFANAGAFLDALNEAQPRDSGEFTFDDSVLERFRNPSIRIERTYPLEELLREDETREVYRSGDVVVKLWNQISEESLGPGIHHFLRRVEELAAAAPEYLAPIRSYGIATRTSQLFLVSDYVSGVRWNELETANIDTKLRLGIIRRFVNAIEHLHELGYSHGDLNPSNVLVEISGNDADLKIIDIPDYSSDGGARRSPRYCPDNVDHCSAEERDNFAVIRMSLELLRIEWDAADSKEFHNLVRAVAEEKASIGAFSSLGRFKDTISAEAGPKSADRTVALILKGPAGRAPITILPENGRLYVALKRSEVEAADRVVVELTGIGGSISLVYSRAARGFVTALGTPKSMDQIYPSTIERATLDASIGLSISFGVSNLFDGLSSYFLANSDFLSQVHELTRPTNVDSAVTLTLSVPLGIDAQSDSGVSTSHVDTGQSLHPPTREVVPTSRLWKAIITAEALARPEIEVAAQPTQSKFGDELIVRCAGNEDALDGFETTDKIFLTRAGKDGKNDTRLGLVNLRLSRASEIRFSPNPAGRSIRIGERLVLTTEQEKQSYLRRKNAIERILDRRPIIANLVDYFDGSTAMQPVELGCAPSEMELSRYDRADPHGNRISLNEAQREAFSRLLSSGPISLLQGPPGTGKTEFIAAFVHHLVESKKANNILLVSQSHEGVNTAAERIRSHCYRLGTDLDVVRFSNRDTTVSPALQDVFAPAIVSQVRELFRAEQTRRVVGLRDSLGVPEEYLRQLLESERHAHALVKRIRRTAQDAVRLDIDDESRALAESALETLEAELRSMLQSAYGIVLDSDPGSAIQQVRDYLARQHGIAPHEARRCHQIMGLVVDFYDRLANDRSNYDEFLARSRTLVCGTCVGIGQGHVGIAGNKYDWVIIDEAARATPGELAVAMQCGKRILLVGDHRQLPPLYKSKHKEAIGREFGMAKERREEIERLLLSDFERIFESSYGKRAGATLRTQYRMQAPIGNLVSSVFYSDTRLENGPRSIPDCFSISPDYLKSVVTWVDTSTLGKRAHHQEDDDSNSKSNAAEADLIIGYLKEIESNSAFLAALSASVKDDEPAIGVICMYEDQRRLLLRRFSEQSWRDDLRSLIKIDTVDGYQGKENRIVIVSITRSDPEQSPGFLRLPNRINVALSRAMDRLVVVGDSRAWSSNWNEGLPLNKVWHFIRERENGVDYRIVAAPISGGRAAS